MEKIDELLMIMRASAIRWSLEEPHMENINIRISRRVLEGNFINIEKLQIYNFINIEKIYIFYINIEKKMDIINDQRENFKVEMETI